MKKPNLKQTELSFNVDKKPRKEDQPVRPEVAKWWFQRMHEVVDTAGQ